MVGAHLNLGVVLLRRKADYDGASAAFREAIRLQPRYAEAHCNLGQALMKQGRFAEALATLRHGHELGSKNPAWPYPSARWVKEAERMIELDRRLPAVLKGEAALANADERLEFAKLCSLKSLHVAAARFFAEALADQPAAVAQKPSEHRYSAACAAALAGCGQGKDAASLDEAARAHWRRQALDWLQAELAALTKSLESASPSSRATVQRMLRYSQSDPNLAGLRDAQALAKLPEPERVKCRRFWAEVAQLVEQREKAKPP
jgi:serine/threonine-protein kinase